MRFLTILFIFSALLSAQTIGPLLQKETATSLLKSNGADYHVIVKGQANFLNQLTKKGFQINAHQGQLASVTVPRNRLADLTAIKSIQKIELGPKNKLHNGIAVNYENVEKAYAQGYTGTDVIMGIVDTGIDFYHPMFLKADGNTRILAIWDQTGFGTPPSGFSIGVEYSESQINQDLASGTPNSYVQQVDVEGHGTHVAGTAAGRALTISPADTLSGGAKNANLIIVKTTLNNTDIVDGVDYIFKKATALGKPAVVNLSLGSQWGPHDGTDLTSQLLDALTGPGKVVVRSAGNSGSSNVHYYAENVASSISIAFGYTSSANLWLEAGDNASSVSLSWSNGSISNVAQNGHKSSNGIDVYFYPADSENGKIAAYILMDNTDLESETFTLTLNNVSDANSNGKITRHMWTETGAIGSPYGAFSQGTSYVSNHYPYTISNGACSANTIAVGAFISRYNWPASDGNTYHYQSGGADGGIASFSAIGPSASGAQKPDIIAGGSIVLSAKSQNSSYQTAFLPPAPYTDNYAYSQGTSMASPAAAGAIALLLEKHPGWTPADVIDYLKNNARGTSRPAGMTVSEMAVKDDPGTWDRVFGFGAVDLTNAFDPNDIEVSGNSLPLQFRLEQNYPNPFNPTTAISYQISASSQIRLTVYNALGQIVRSLVDQKQEAGTYSVALDGSDLSSGIYFYELSSGTEIQVRKMVLMR